MSVSEKYALLEQKEKTAREQLNACVDELARELGNGWEVSERSNENTARPIATMLNARDGRSFYLSVQVSPTYGKTTISGIYDYGDKSLGLSWPYKLSRPEISVSLSRGGKAIAKEITRRFLPDYDNCFALIRESVRSYTEYRDKKLAVSQRLASLFVVGPKHVSADGFETFSSEKPYFQVSVSSATVTLKIENLSEELAVKVIKLVNSASLKEEKGK